MLFLVSTTANKTAYYAIKSALGDDHILSPRLSSGSFQPLDYETNEIITHLAYLKQLNYDRLDGIICERYGPQGLYSENINANSEFPIDATSGDAVFILAINPFYKQSNNPYVK